MRHWVPLLRWLLMAGVATATGTAQQEGELLERFLKADPAQQADIASAAESGFDHGWYEQRARSTQDPRERAAALALLRAARAPFLKQPRPEIECLLSIVDPPSAAQQSAGFPESNGSPYREARFWPLLVATDLRVVRRGLIELYNNHRLTAPIWIRRGLLDDPMASVRRQALAYAIDHEEVVQVLLPLLAQDRPPLLPYTLFPPYLLDLSAPDRTSLAGALIQAAQRPRPPASGEPLSPNKATWGWDYPRRRRDDASACTAALATIGASAMAEALRVAAPVDAEAAITMLAGALTWDFDTQSAAACERHLLALLRHADARIVDLAGEVAGNLLANCAAPRLRAALDELALAALRQRPPGSALGCKWLPAFCGNGPPPVALVPGQGGGLVRGACRAGDPSLFEPLLEMMKEQAPAGGGQGPAGGPPAPNAQGLVRRFAMDGLTELAPHLAADQALRLWEVNEAMRGTPVEWAPFRAGDVRARLYASLPDDQAAACLQSFAKTPEQLAALVRDLGHDLDRLPAKRLAPLLPEGLPADPNLLLAVPERLNAAFRGGPAQRSQALARLQEALMWHGAKVAALARAGRLDEALVAEAQAQTIYLPKPYRPQLDVDLLTALRTREVWSAAEEGQVLYGIVDQDPAVRCVAFRALQSRDVALWDCRLFFAAAQFDPDAAVRELGQ